MIAHRIRPISLGIIRRHDRIFVMEAYDAVKDQTFYRPPGGGIEFGETSLEALVREFREELNAELTNIRLYGCYENLFTFEGGSGHEIVFMYEADFADEAFYRQDSVQAREVINGIEVPFTCRWMTFDQFDERTPLYPEGILQTLQPN